MASGEVRLFLEHAGAVGLAVCLATLLDGAAPQSGIFGIGAGSEEFLLSSLISFAFVCLLAAVRFALSADDPKRLMAFGGLLASLGFVAFEFVRVPGIEIPMGVGCGALFGFGLGTSCVYWGASFGSLGQQKAVAVLALVCLFAGLFRVALLLLPQPWQGGLFGVLLMLSFLQMKSQGKDLPAPTSADEESALVRTRGMLERNWVVFAALVPCILLVAFSWSGNMRGADMVNNPQIETSWGLVAGMMLSAVLFLFLSRWKQGRLVDDAFVVVPVLATAGVMVSWFLGAWEQGFGQVASNIPLGFLQASVVTLLIAGFSKEVRNGLASAFVSGLCCAALAILFLGFFVVWPLLGDRIASGVSLSFEAVYLAAVAVRLAVRSHVSATAPLPSAEKNADERCLALASRYGLSKRELETLVYLAQGRSAPYIADEQFLSVNTVRTHIKRIYAKMDVHSKEELLDLFHKS